MYIMAITLEHFCTKTGKPIVANGEPIIEKIEHCLAEYFAPNATFKLGVVYQGLTTEQDLKQFTSQGLTLEFAADRRFYFMDEMLREKLFDQPHFGAAYGSNLFTPCKSFSEQENLRVLVVDANTGENGGMMPNSDAIALVGDGDGKIDIRLHTSLGNQEATPFQTRFGIKERRAGLDVNDENQPPIKTWQLGKGTFAPRDLREIGNGYDLIISTDQLKGRVVGERESEELGERGKGGQRKTDNAVDEYSLLLYSLTPTFSFFLLPSSLELIMTQFNFDKPENQILFPSLNFEFQYIDKISVVIIEDHELTLIGIKTSLQRDEKIVIAGDAVNGKNGLDLLNKLQPDIAIIDISLPDKDGIQITREIKEKNTKIKVIILTLWDCKDTALRAFAVGADSYCIKNIGFEKLIEVIYLTYCGHTWIDPTIAHFIRLI